MALVYESNGYTIDTVDDATGKVVSKTNPQDPGYWPLLVVMDKKKQAGYVNSQNQAKYLADVNSYNTALQTGKPLPPIPTKPMMQVVDDSGNVTNVAFVPALPDVMTVTPIPVSPSGALQPIVGPSQDQKLDILINLITQLLNKLGGANPTS